ncbi:FAD-linked oxidase [Noviherbaspirillum denitrificans]|uniref:FAD-linked oxidase n=2 Tax=Noviherbaspirillum denitrificans TaxID=1968433 RepID=A0A254TK23_9BURK|nr:FAD-linked oxidase [Noviherbaspirillum denitrificans]
MNLTAAIGEWQTLLGAANVLQADDAQKAYDKDASGIKRRIPAALRIQDAGSVPEAMRIAARNKIAVYPISTGHNWGYGTSLPVRDDCVIIDLSGMRKIVHFDAELGVVTVEPGVTQEMLAEFLDAGGHPFLVPVTGGGPQCSLLGNALERGYGITPYTDHFAAVTDIEAVLADGSLYRTALREAAGDDLARLFKWGLGTYSAGLFTQSGFGIVTRMTIALARRPECVKVCFFSLKEDALLEPTVAAIRDIISRLPGTIGGINLMNQHRVLAMSAPYPTDRIGPDGLIPESVIQELGRQYQVFPWTGFGTVYGTRRMVAAAQKEMKAALAGKVSRLVFISPAGAKALSKLAAFLPGAAGQRLGSTSNTLAKALELVNGRPNETALPLAYWRNPTPPQGDSLDPSRDGCGLIWYAPLVPMRPGSVRAYADMVKRIAVAHGIEPLITFTSISDKLFDSTVPIIFRREDEQALARATACYENLLQEGRLSGFFPYRVGVNTMSTLSSLQNDSLRFHKRLRHAVDPDNLLSPGRYQ